MRSPRPSLDPAVLQPLLEQLIRQHPHAHFTLAQAEEAVLTLFRHLGPALLEGMLTGAAAPAAAKKGHRRSVRAASPSAGIATSPAPSAPNSATST